MNIGWTDRLMVVIFYALFLTAAFSDESKADSSSSAASGRSQNSGKGTEGGSGTSEQELDALRRELGEVLLKAEEQNKELLRLQLGVCSAMESPGAKAGAGADACVHESLSTVRTASKEMLSGIFEFCELADKMAGLEQIPEVDRVRFKCRLDDLKSSAEKMSLLLNPPDADADTATECRILSTNDALQIAVISAGTVKGVCPGMILKTGQTVLKIVVAKPFISAAIVVEGRIAGLAPGMQIKIESSK